MTQELERTPLPEAVRIVLEYLNKRTNPMTINDIAKDTKLNHRTVQKAVEIMQLVSSMLESKRLLVSKTDGVTIVQTETKQVGLLNLPLDVQKMLIRTKYFPVPSKEENIVTYLYLRDALGKDKAVNLPENNTLEQLIEAEQIEKVESGYYLTDIGKMVAIGALEIYPELKEGR
ncbi:MAG: hypothetical protein ACREBQ_01765 [Nitrososphaerales archaeon]